MPRGPASRLSVSVLMLVLVSADEVGLAQLRTVSRDRGQLPHSGSARVYDMIGYTPSPQRVYKQIETRRRRGRGSVEELADSTAHHHRQHID
jgi:hypothetical protein